ncbi:MAG TPA: alpha/beta fold hydrolase, partial [Ilumatobacteraceae bacterium]|nr:alpha/beta fold hydrolase [Ilumatobacteraceae bacterium]
MEADAFPQAILDRFDLVGFDPRGVGASSAVSCPVSFDITDADDVSRCIDRSHDLLAHLGTPNVARDLELIRVALGDPQLSYLGFSYGTALGAVYATMFPASVRALVLDGAIDPDAGIANEQAGAGYDFYVQQDFGTTLDVFFTLCDVSVLCPAGPDSESLLDDVYDEVRNLPVAYFGDHEPLRRVDVEDVVYGAMYGIFTWPLLAHALSDAADGDASTIAALASYLRYGYPADMEAEPNFEFANLAIRCADFSNRGADAFECAPLPDSADDLPVITAVDTPNPILVIGTDDDPATPGRYAGQLADALGDAVDINWAGAGHTAFLTSACVTDLTTAYL